MTDPNLSPEQQQSQKRLMISDPWADARGLMGRAAAGGVGDGTGDRCAGDRYDGTGQALKDALYHARRGGDMDRARELAVMTKRHAEGMAQGIAAQQQQVPKDRGLVVEQQHTVRPEPPYFKVSTSVPADPLTCFNAQRAEVVRIAHDGEVFWKGRRVEGDEQFKRAMLELADCLRGGSAQVTQVGDIFEHGSWVTFIAALLNLRGKDGKLIDHMTLRTYLQPWLADRVPLKHAAR